MPFDAALPVPTASGPLLLRATDRGVPARHIRHLAAVTQGQVSASATAALAAARVAGIRDVRGVFHPDPCCVGAAGPVCDADVALADFGGWDHTGCVHCWGTKLSHPLVEVLATAA